MHAHLHNQTPTCSTPQEHKLYPRCVAALCEGRISWREDGIPIMWTAA